MEYIDGEIYTISGSSISYNWITKNLNSGKGITSSVCFFDNEKSPSYYSSEGSFGLNYKNFNNVENLIIVKSTKEEKQWLQDCITAGKLVEQRKVSSDNYVIF